MEDYSKYNTLFDYVKENNISGYHYDIDRSDDDHPLLHFKSKFKGDWNEEIERFKVKQTINFDLDNPTTRLQWKHWLALGYDPHKFSEKAEINAIDHPKIQKIVDAIQLENKQVWITRQKPGCYVPYHHDVLSSAKDIDIDQSKELGIRILVFLNDWTPGEFMIWGTKNVMKWKAGDILTWPACHFPHATANAGFRNGYRLRISGLRTSAFEEFVKSNEVLEIN